MRVATIVLLALCTSLAVAQTPTPSTTTAPTTTTGVSLESEVITTLRADLRALGDQYVALHNGWYFNDYIPVVLAELNDPENPVPAEEITTYSTFFNNDADKVQQHTMWNEVVSDKASALNEALQTVILGNGEDIPPADLADVEVTRTQRQAAYDAAMIAADEEFNTFAAKTGPAMQQKAAEVMQFEDWLPVMGRGRQIALQSDMAQIGVMNAALRPQEGDPAPPDPLDKLPDADEAREANKANGDGKDTKKKEPLKGWQVLAIGGGICVLLVGLIGFAIVKVMNKRARDRPMGHQELQNMNGGGRV